ncbi:MAG: PAS domain S-box protein [Deltaproteobacteria bacterium]
MTATAALAHTERTEAALRASEERYRLLVEGIEDHAIFMLDPNGLVASWNAGARRIKGYAASEIIGRHFSCFFPSAERGRGRPDEILRLTAATGRHEEDGMRVRRDGSQFLSHLTFTAMRDPNGVLVGFSELSHDLTESERSAARYRGLLEAAPDAMVVVDAAGKIVLLNLQAEHQFGYSRDELLGQRITNIIPEGFAERILSDGTRTAAEALAQHIGTGIELSAQRKDETRFPIEIMLSPLLGADGILITAAIRDISVRKAAEAHLEQMREWYRALIETAPDPMVVAKGGEIILVNRQTEVVFGYPRAELVGQSVEMLVPERLRTGDILARLGDIAPGQPLGGLEITGCRKDGTEFQYECSLSPMESPEGTLVTAVIRDLTLRKKAEAHLLAEAQLTRKMEELARSNEELGQFAYVASHDLQEPLRMVASYTQLLAKRYKGKLDADADEFIGFAVDGANRMQRLIQDLLAYSRVGTTREELRNVSAEDALLQALANLQGAIEDAHVEVTHDAMPMVFADPSQLVQLFQNLISNGIKYQASETPRVHVSAAKDTEGRWLFSVEDNGLGIDAQYFERIFGMFQRLHKREEFAGTGIGLAICKKIVEGHGGRISVESEPGRGSTFRFSLGKEGV